MEYYIDREKIMLPYFLILRKKKRYLKYGKLGLYLFILWLGVVFREVIKNLEQDFLYDRI
jgi:hypothetical protein